LALGINSIALTRSGYPDPDDDGVLCGIRTSLEICSGRGVRNAIARISSVWLRNHRLARAANLRWAQQHSPIPSAKLLQNTFLWILFPLAVTKNRGRNAEAMITGDRRTAIRNALIKHMEVDRMTAGEIARHITANESMYGGKVNRDAVARFINLAAGKVVDKSVLVLEQYMKYQAPAMLQEAKEELTRRVEGKTRHRLFPAALSFYRVVPKKVDLHRDAILGEYSFYAYSEREVGKVCLGAIQFYTDRVDEFCVRELQQSIPGGGRGSFREEYRGHFFFREKELIVVQRDKNRLVPKFYIMSILSWKNATDRYAVMEGSILKIGEQKPVFSHNIYMVRRSDAFTKCNMLNVSDVPDDVMASLNSRKWGAPHERYHEYRGNDRDART
jgi:hypothetical protein